MKLKREHSIALLIALAIGLLIFGYNFLRGMDIFQKRNIFHVVYGNVSGITESSPVLLNGYKVGQVVNTALLSDGSGRIAVSFQLDEDRLEIPKDSRIQIYSADLFSRALQLQPGTSGTMAVAGDTLMGDVQLSLTDAVGEQIDPLKKKAEGMLASVDSVLNSLQLILNDSARRDIDASFASIRSTLETLNNSARRIDGLIGEERAAIHAVVENIRQVTGNLVQYNEEIARILSNMDTISSTLASGEVKRMVADLSESSQRLKGIMAKVDAGEGTLGALVNNDSLYRNLESASRELDLLMEDLRLNPNRYVQLSLFGKKDRLPKLSDSDVDRIKRSLEEDKSIK
jgi:phospholipid/cholesterol/gamma-HCH transport system substrate-binding protein